jgi:tetratricopeptide (TPR) repeat protein
MPGNRALYERAMEQSREAARLKQWDNALKNAARALQEFPQETEARTTVAVALFHTGKLEQALQLLHELSKADPDNSFYLEYIARAQARKGDTDAAIATYQTLLDMHEQQRAVVKTITVLREMLRLRPHQDDQREKLAHLLSETRETADAAAEYLNLARRYHEQGRLDDAAERAEEAARLDPESREAKETIIAIRDDMANAAGLEKPEAHAGGDGTSGFASGRSMTSSLRSQDFTLEKQVSLAMEKQEAGDNDGAIAGYEQVIQQGLERADVFYSLGLLYQEQGKHEAAVKMLSRSTNDPEYALSAHFALGSSYTEMQQLSQAAQEYEQAIGLVDLATIGKAESEDLIQMYEQVTAIYQQLGDIARAASLYSTLANFLKSKRWGRERGEEFQKRAKELTDRNMLAKLRSLGTGALAPIEGAPPREQHPEPEEPVEEMPEQWGKIPSIIDFLRSDNIDVATDPLTLPTEVLPQGDALDMLDTMGMSETTKAEPVTPLDTSGLSEQIARWVVASERYIEQGCYDAALDACYEVMQLQPDYLSIHLRMGEIFERQNLNEEALAKYQTLIDTFTVRNEPALTIDVYFRYINLAPDTINSRARLADLLNQVGRTQEAAEQLAQIASSYFRMGQTNRALEEYRRGLQWAPKSKELRSQYGLALFKLERYEAALNEFHRAADPTDPIAIAHINMTLAALAEQPVAIWDSLAALLELLQDKNGSTANSVQAEYRTALLSLDDSLLHYILGIIQQHCEQHSSALLEFEQAQAMLETEEHALLPIVLVHQAMASSYIELEQPDQAREQLQFAHQAARHTRVDPAIKHSFARPLSQGELVWQMAEAYAAGEDLASAEKALREALRHLPYNQHIYTKLADVCFRQGKLDEALSSLGDLATHHENRQDLDKAIEILEYALKLAPGSITIGERLARLYIRRGYPDQGVEGLIRVAELQRKEGHIKDAVANLQQAGEIRWMQGKAEETLSIYDRIVKIAPKDLEARQWRAIMYTLVSRTDEAIAEKKQIVTLLAQRKDFDNAIAELHQIIGLDTNDVDAYFMLGDMLMQRGEYAQALSLYNRLSRMNAVEVDRVEALIAAANRMLQNQQLTS